MSPPTYFLHLSFMKMSISCLLKSIVSVKHFESDFGRDIVLLLKITQIRVITTCVVLDHSTVIFQKEGGYKLKIIGMQDTNSQGRQKYKIGHGIDDLKVIMNKKNPEQISSDSFLTIY